MSEYIKNRQKQLEKKWQREAELEAEKEARKEARMVAEARKREEIAERKRLLEEQRETARLRQKHIQGKEKLANQKWNGQLDTLLAQIKSRAQQDDKLEEIRFIIQNRESPLQALDWTSWLSDPFNQRLADLDFEHAMEMFKRDNLMAKRRHGTRGKKKYNYSLTFAGNTGASAADDYVTTAFNPDDYNLNLGFTVSYWVRPDAVGSTMFAFGRKHSNTQRFVFGINKENQVYCGTGQNKLTKSWNSMGATSLFPDLFDGSDLKTGNWLHFVVTYADRADTSAAAERKLYLNGVHLDTGGSNINWSNTGGGTAGMMFGGRRLTGTGYNNGWACGLDEVAIYDTAKDDTWVANVYNGGDSFDHTGAGNLVGYWKFNEGSGTTVEDLSGEGNHGTFAAISGDTTAYPTWEIKT